MGGSGITDSHRRRVQDNDQPRGYHLVAQPSPEFWPEIYRSAQSSSSPRISIHPAYVGNGTLDEKAMPMTVLPYAIPPKRWYKAEQRPLEILGSQEERCSSMSDSATASNSAGAGQSPEGAAAEEEEAGEGGGEEGEGQGDDGGPSEDEAEAGGEGDEGGHSEDEGKAGSEGEGVERDSDDADEAAVEGLITASTDDIEDPADIPSAPVFPAIDVARLYERDQAWWTAFGAGNRAPQFLRLRPGKIVNMYLGEGIKDEHKQILVSSGFAAPVECFLIPGADKLTKSAWTDISRCRIQPPPMFACCRLPSTKCPHFRAIAGSSRSPRPLRTAWSSPIDGLRCQLPKAAKKRSRLTRSASRDGYARVRCPSRHI